MLREFWSDGLFAERDHRYWRLINRANTMRGIINEDAINNEASFSDFKKIFWGKNIGKEAYFDSMTHFDFKTLLPALLQVEDRMSMAHGVEARVPFLDHPLIEFAATIPADIKFKNGELKRLLKYSFKGHLPNQILDRKDKMGFPVPLNLWLENGGRARDYIGDVLGSKKARSRGYLADKISIDKVLDSQSIYGRNLWALLSLELWHQQFID
jgi:asparagine synthase (glutamine-hydrolysing)